MITRFSWILFSIEDGIAEVDSHMRRLVGVNVSVVVLLIVSTRQSRQGRIYFFRCYPSLGIKLSLPAVECSR